MKALKPVLTIVVVLLICIIAVYGYYGGFSPVNISTSVQGGETVIYKDVTGDYSQTRVISDEIYRTLLNDYKIETTRGFGVFYDNPQQVEKSKLRSKVGCILDSETDSAGLSKISAQFRTMILPEGNYITTELPMRGMLSVIIGIFKVYPKINNYLIENNIQDDSPITEIYDIVNSKIIYRKQIMVK